MKVYVYEDDDSLLKLLTLHLESRGHQVHGFLNTPSCPPFPLEEFSCLTNQPCAEALILGTGVEKQEAIQILVNQEEKGCKLPKPNKAILSTNLSNDQIQNLVATGYSVIKKPFRLSTIIE